MIILFQIGIFDTKSKNSLKISKQKQTNEVRK